MEFCFLKLVFVIVTAKLLDFHKSPSDSLVLQGRKTANLTRCLLLKELLGIKDYLFLLWICSF